MDELVEYWLSQAMADLDEDMKEELCGDCPPTENGDSNRCLTCPFHLSH